LEAATTLGQVGPTSRSRSSGRLRTRACREQRPYLDEFSDLLVDDAIRVEASAEAGAFIRERGGALYVWLKPLNAVWGTIHVATDPPSLEVDFETIDAGGFEVLLDPELSRPAELRITLRHFPRAKVRVRGLRAGVDGGGDCGGGGGDVCWDSGGGGGGGGDGGGGHGHGGGGGH
jgi:hypothetical protein